MVSLARAGWRRSTAWVILAALGVMLVGCAPRQGMQTGAAHQPEWREIFPHVRMDAARRMIEIDGTVPIRLDDPEAPIVYLELIACIPNTREHEVLVVTPALPSHVHAALLTLGLTPGVPAEWRLEGGRLIAIPPRGDAVRVELIYDRAEGSAITARPEEWILDRRTGLRPEPVDWVFAGSMESRRPGGPRYAADGEGAVIGLCTFGSEVLAYPRVVSPEASIDAPQWIADAATVPPMNTKVRIRLSRAAATPH